LRKASRLFFRLPSQVGDKEKPAGGHTATAAAGPVRAAVTVG
jgi:hypothetical protein